jgi:hypothetical protein
MSRTYEILAEQEQRAEQERKAKQELMTTTAGNGFGHDDGFDDDSGDDFLPLIFCDVTQAGNEWQDRHGEPLGGTRWLVTAVDSEVVYWGKDGRPDQTKSIRRQQGVPLLDRDEVDELNEKTDRSEWRESQFGPKGPWQLQWYVFLLDPTTAARKKFVTSTWGGQYCWNEIKSAITGMRKLRGQPRICPVVELQLTAYGKKGPKTRPYLKPVAWMEFGNGGATMPALAAPVPLAIAEPAEPAKPPIGDDLNDEIPF